MCASHVQVVFAVHVDWAAKVLHAIGMHDPLAAFHAHVGPTQLAWSAMSLQAAGVVVNGELKPHVPAGRP